MKRRSRDLSRAQNQPQTTTFVFVVFVVFVFFGGCSRELTEVQYVAIINAVRVAVRGQRSILNVGIPKKKRKRGGGRKLDVEFHRSPQVLRTSAAMDADKSVTQYNDGMTMAYVYIRRSHMVLLLLLYLSPAWAGCESKVWPPFKCVQLARIPSCNYA